VIINLPEIICPPGSRDAPSPDHPSESHLRDRKGRCDFYFPGHGLGRSKVSTERVDFRNCSESENDSMSRPNISIPSQPAKPEKPVGLSSRTLGHSLAPEAGVVSGTEPVSLPHSVASGRDRNPLIACGARLRPGVIPGTLEKALTRRDSWGDQTHSRIHAGLDAHCSLP
jgi:hypothetical protein